MAKVQYEGNYIDAYIICLDNGTRWIFNWSIYEKVNAGIRAGDWVEITPANTNQYWMTIMQNTGLASIPESFLFTRCGPCSFRAIPS